MVISTIARGASANPAHAVTVALAIILMVVHAAWAAVVLARENREAIARFHDESNPCRSCRFTTYNCDAAQAQQSYAHYGDALGILSIRRRER